MLTLGKDLTARLWETRTARLIAVLRKGGERVVNCGYSSDGRTIFTDDLGSVARFWDVPSGRFRAETDPRLSRYVRTEDWNSPILLNAAQISGGRLLTRRYVSQGRNSRWEGPIELWDTATGRLVTRFDRLDLPAREFKLVGGGRWVTTREKSSALLVYSAEDGLLRGRLSHPEEGVIAEHVDASPSGRWIATVTPRSNHNNLLEMWDTRSWKAAPGAVMIYRWGFEFVAEDLFVAQDPVNTDGIPLGGPWKLYRVGEAEPIARSVSSWPDKERGGELFHLGNGLFHLGNGQVIDTQRRQRLLPPTGWKFHPELARFAVDERFVRADWGLVDTRTEKHLSCRLDWQNLPGFGMVAVVGGYGAKVQLLPPPNRLDLPPDLLELWAQVAVRGEIGPDGSFVKWDEPAWERKRQELTARPAPRTDFPFPGYVATDRLHWLRKEYENASDADKPRLARELLARAEAAGDKAEAAQCRARAEPQ